MLRTLVAAISLVTLVFTLLIQVVNGTTYDAAYFSELSAFLSPTAGCPSPCFMGIRPGSTNVDNALEILRQHPWVAQVKVSAGTDDMFSGSIYWTWSSSIPAYIDPYWQGNIFVMGRMVRNIRVRTNILYGDIALLYSPHNSQFSFSSSQAYMLHQTMFRELGFEAESFVPCPLHLDAVWRASVVMNVHLTTISGAPSGVTLSDWLRKSPCKRTS